MKTTTTKAALMSEKEKRDTVARIKDLIESRGLVARRLDEMQFVDEGETSDPDLYETVALVEAVRANQAKAEAFAIVFLEQLSFRGFKGEKLRRELAVLARISNDNYLKAKEVISNNESEN